LSEAGIGREWVTVGSVRVKLEFHPATGGGRKVIPWFFGERKIHTKEHGEVKNFRVGKANETIKWRNDTSLEGRTEDLCPYGTTRSAQAREV